MSTTTATVLAVDDEASVLTALSRLLRTEGVRLLTANGGDEALEMLEASSDGVSVVISDYSMPGMDGADLLRAVGARWPDITRVLLTGNADLPAAARAVNEGRVSRLCTKPWRPNELRQVIVEAINQHNMLLENRRLRALADEQAERLAEWNRRLEKEVADRTAQLESANAGLQRSLLETVRLLLTFLEQRLPDRAAMARDCARLAGRIAEKAAMPAGEVRRVQVAAMIHDIGLLSLPESITRSSVVELPPAGRLQFQQHAELGQKLLSSVEQLQEMGTWIRHHHERWDGKGYPDRIATTAIPFPARILAMVEGYLEAAPSTASLPMWLKQQRVEGAYDPDLLELLATELLPPPPPEEKRVTVLIADLQAGMILDEDIRSSTKAVVLRAGSALTTEQLDRVQRFLAAGALESDVVTIAA